VAPLVLVPQVAEVVEVVEVVEPARLHSLSPPPWQ
jgi:hypothetical protein